MKVAQSRGVRKMRSVKFDLEAIKQRIQAIKAEAATTINSQTCLLDEKTDKCQQCNGTGYIIKEWTGGGLAAECTCREQERLMKRFNSAMIPDEFRRATFQDYKVGNQSQKALYDAAVAYLQEFGQQSDDIFGSSKNSLGFIAVVGESRLKALPAAKRMEEKRRHNNYGLGKTHLQMAIAKELIKRGVAVLCVSDAALMDELMALKMEEDKTFFTKRMNDIINVPVLVWDDIGKSNPTEAKRSAYFQIINERYRHQRPIIYSSNEDVETLSDRIGDAAASRLFGMSKGRIVRVEGPDYRLTGGKQHERTTA
jgi:DNA replication protein DnaC